MRTLDPGTEAGAHALQRLDMDLAGWLTTINAEGQPQSSVAFNLDTTDDGDDYVTMEGETRIDRTVPPSASNPAYQAKYGHMLERYGWTPEWVSENYPVPILIRPTRWRLPEAG